MQCVILAGGLGTRMQSVTQTLPKSLLPVGEHPFLKYQLDALEKQGVQRAVLCIGHQGDKIRAYVEEAGPRKLTVEFVDEGTSLKGTGGAVRLVFDSGKLEPVFMVIYGDSFLPIDFRQVWNYFQTREEPALMTVLRNEERWDHSNASFQGDKVTLYDKKIHPKPAEMRYIDYGLTLWRRSAIEREIPRGEPYDLADLLGTLSRRGELAGYEVTQRFYEIGSPAGLADFRQFIHQKKTQ
jgi:N-acetyl-alpha-D-muramate 1-phosphate uridylyltransferase